MVGNTSRETHFRYKPFHALSTDLLLRKGNRVNIISDAFKSKMQPARHRMVYALLKEEMAMEGGIHALQLRTRTVEEDARASAKESI